MLYIVRHGQTDLNSRKVLQGRSDHPLNAVGEEQAREIGDVLSDVRFDRVFSSPLKRAVRTAEIIAPYAPMTIDERLIEMEYGPYEGLGLDSLPVEVLEFFSDFVNNSAPEGMEPLP
ncbi:MAG: histidine phosphatase family protein, partial [Candidatus Methanomethylophilaceae archaeon]|nr:histidine phosphatase family protein [Candidatus Methanomethylophilaceae archaeon]